MTAFCKDNYCCIIWTEYVPEIDHQLLIEHIWVYLFLITDHKIHLTKMSNNLNL